ncbi:RnfABCDGE type electron transport complex subunit D [Treponema sp. OMZ 840]|uniref:RnfABCDGE type electron transport complex subunit D n=1 Tax=Treponema sp. OMZ 840 TaxID=244313 RepID=UPI003D92E4E4
MRRTYDFITLDPFCSSSPSVTDIIKMSLVVLLPQIVMLFITKSYASLYIILCSIIAALLSQICFALMQKTKAFFAWPPVLQAVLVGLFLPASYPLPFIFCTVFCVLFLQNIIFGTFAQSWANTVAVTVILLYLMNPQPFSSSLPSYEYFTYTNAASRLYSEGILQPVSFDIVFTDFLNTMFYSLGISVPEGYISLLWDSQSMIPAFRFNILTLAASLVLVSYQAADAVCSYVFLFVYGFLVRIFSLYPYGGMFGGGDMLLALCTSGTLFTAFFILGWFGTVPQTFAGKCIYGMLGGILMFCICGGGMSSAGAIFTVMMLNVISPAIQYIEDTVYGIQLGKILTHAGIKEASHE